MVLQRLDSCVPEVEATEVRFCLTKIRHTRRPCENRASIATAIEAHPNPQSPPKPTRPLPKGGQVCSHELCRRHPRPETHLRPAVTLHRSDPAQVLACHDHRLATDQRAIHHGWPLCTNLILDCHRINRSYQHTRSDWRKSSGKRRARQGLCTTANSDCSTPKRSSNRKRSPCQS